MPRPRRKTNEGMLIKSAELLGWALGGLEREIAQTRDRLASLTAQANRLRARVGSKATPARGPAAASSAEPAVTGRKRRRMSAEARKRISDAATKRWAEWRKAAKNKAEGRRQKAEK